MRAFLAIQLSVDARRAIQQLQELLESSKADVRWVAFDHLHVTLKFFENISEEEEHALEKLVEGVAAGQQPFGMNLEGVGAFPSLKSPRVLWVGIKEGTRELTEIAHTIETAAVSSLHIGREERGFAVHVTIGRVRSSRGQMGLIRRLQDIPWECPVRLLVKTITFYESHLRPTGPEYSILADIPLGMVAQ